MDPVLKAAADHWDGIHAAVGPERSAELDDLAAELAGVHERSARLRLRLKLIRLLRESLPADHPVRQAIREGERSVAPADEDRDTAAGLLAETAARRAMRLAELDLLAEPGYTPQEVRDLGGDPERTGLLRLPLPGGGHRLPAFQFGERGEVPAVVLVINELLRADTDPWGVADWWMCGNSWLDAVPAGLVGTVPDGELVAAARAVRGEE
ncbi:hypothetical protein [Spongiactinospora sp. TRM90649]|uniref:hypothetical protein n=1 Tax=Spongiactinospora sp. TRM90649 TaxID=3031114 RepID=UPI0023F7F4DC|nr:hypothetical protein [Spongiactinospora sp. TRM90649]MDF5757504.1 hypothetical protein [Spongiactinospora sp. TRM90649]